MNIVRTVCGDIAPEELGYCQTHEHIWCDYRTGVRRHLQPTVVQDPKDTMLLDDRDRALDELRHYRRRGGSALVEVTTEHWGRDLGVLRELSQHSGVHIIATSGFYMESTLPPWIETTGIRDIANILIQDLTEGDSVTGIKPGIFKSAIMRGRIEGPELKALRAIARAVLETGASMTTHTTGTRRYEIPGGTVGIEHLRIFDEEGAPADRLIVGHVDERPDIGILTALAERGCYIQFDVIGQMYWLMDETRADLLRELVNRGHLQRLLLGTDRCNKSGLYREQGGLGYAYILDHFLQTLRERAGFSSGEIEEITVANPARALALDA